MQTFIKIHPNDNVIVALQTIPAGTSLEVSEGINVTSLVEIPSGHKMAITDIAVNTEIIKYGSSIGFAKEDILAGKIKNAMIIGKGSLFLGRMTNLFDGCSFVIQANTGAEAANAGVSEEEVKGLIAKAMKDFAASLLAE